MVLDPIPQPLPVHFFGSRPQPPTSRPASLWRDSILAFTRVTWLMLFHSKIPHHPLLVSRVSVTHLIHTVTLSSSHYSDAPWLFPHHVTLSLHRDSFLITHVFFMWRDSFLCVKWLIRILDVPTCTHGVNLACSCSSCTCINICIFM